ncbi:MAG: GGDEF domain-containing protein [Treponemataceae bacterium]|nr:GGDEF domain-containing protein [Treponemataceae bacterium]
MELSKEISCNIKDFFDSMDSVRYISCDSGLMKQIPSFVSDDCIIMDFMKPSVNFTPMAPFLSVLQKQITDVAQIEDYVYGPQKDTFVSYFSDGVSAFRDDIPVFEQFQYEHKRSLKSVFEIFSHVVASPLVILNAQLMDSDSFEIVRMLEDSHRCKTLVCIDLTETELNNDSSAFFSELSSKENYYEAVREGIHESKDLMVVLEENNFFNPDNVLKFFVDCNNFFSFGNSATYAKKLLQERPTNIFSSDKIGRIMLEMSWVFFCTEDYENAEICLNSIIDKEEFADIQVSVKYCLSNIFFKRKAFFDATQLVCNLIDLSKDSDSDCCEFYLAHSMLCRIMQKQKNPELQTKYFETLELFKNQEKRFINNYIETLFLIPCTVFDSECTEIEKYISAIDEAIELSGSIDNELALSEAYNIKGLLYSRLLKHTEAIECLNKADIIRRKLDDVTAVVNIRNSIVNEMLIQGDYLKAFKVMVEVSDQVLQLSDTKEILYTLNNVSKIYLFIGYYAECRRLLNSIAKIMRVYDKKSITGYSLNDVYAIQALIDIYYGKYTHAHLWCRNIKSNGLPYSDFSNVILITLSALFAMHNGKLEKSKKLFAVAEKRLMDKIPEQKQLLAYIRYLYSYFLYRKEEDELSDVYRKQAEQVVQDENFTFYIENYAEVPIRRIYTLDFFLPHFLVSLERLERQSTKDQILYSLKKRIRDSQFLNRLMEFAGSAETRDEYIEDVVSEISDYMLCKAIYFAKIDEDSDEWIISHSIVRNSKYLPEEGEWKYLMIKTVDSKTNFIPILDNVWYYNLSKYESSAAVIIELDNMKKYKREDLNILKIGLSNIQSQLTILSQREHLQQLSSIDQLSKLNNRRALEEKLESESELIRRYDNKENVKYLTSITFIDLDHFKFYNDTYGHEAGDVMIESFAKLLKRIYRKVDFVSRFGGDEFIVLLPGTSSLEALRATDRLRQGIVEENYFIPALEKVLHRDMSDIPKEQYISFSAGICANTEIDDFSDMQQVKNNADKALYEAKETGRCKTVLYTELTPEKQNVKPR